MVTRGSWAKRARGGGHACIGVDPGGFPAIADATERDLLVRAGGWNCSPTVNLAGLAVTPTTAGSFGDPDQGKGPPSRPRTLRRTRGADAGAAPAELAAV